MRAEARALALCALVATVAWLAGCAQTGGVQTAPAPSSAPAPLPPNAEPPPPNVNLSGFPLAYRQGYADGCASASGAERRDAERYRSDGNYRTGWMDGQALCRKR